MVEVTIAPEFRDHVAVPFDRLARLFDGSFIQHPGQIPKEQP